jgi:hypothetical protein
VTQARGNPWGSQVPVCKPTRDACVGRKAAASRPPCRRITLHHCHGGKCGFYLLLIVTLEIETERCRWLTPITLATLEAEIRRIAVQSQPGK